MIALYHKNEKVKSQTDFQVIFNAASFSKVLTTFSSPTICQGAGKALGLNASRKAQGTSKEIPIPNLHET
jgi:hypothetical protein